jgi:hypothetical protein
VADPNDLVDQSDCIAGLACANPPLVLSTAQLARLPVMITSASKSICRYCLRFFALSTYDSIILPMSGEWDDDQPDVVQVPYFPIQSPPAPRVSGCRTTALSITNNNTSTNQQAWVEITTTGDPEIQLTNVGLTLNRVSSGTLTVDATLAWTSYATVQLLANAVNALSSFGWQATVQGGYGQWGTTELVGGDGALGCLGIDSAYLDLFSINLGNCRIDRAEGVIYLPRGGALGNRGTSSFNPSYSTFDEPAGASMGLSEVRVRWMGGWAVIPEPIQTACVELVKAMYEKLSTDTTLDSETAKDYTWHGRALIPFLPDYVRESLSRYRCPRG